METERMKPTWDNAPHWASYLAMDSDCRWLWHEHKPTWKYGMWWTNREGRVALAQDLEYIPDKSLEKRDE